MNPAPRALLAALAAAAALAGCAGNGHLVVRRGPKVLAPVAPVDAVAAPGVAPSAPGPAAALAPIRVRRGDSLWSLARRHLGRGPLWPAIAQANGLAAPWILQPRQLLALPPGANATAAAAQRPVDEARRYGWPAVPNRAFTVGEKLDFAVQYGGVTAGYATLSIPVVELREGRPCFRIEAHARTIPFFETFFTVEDSVVSCVDVDHAFSWHYEKHIHEGGFRADATYVYDQRGHRMLEPAKGKDQDMPPLAQDILSCFYYFRLLPMKPGDTLLIPVMADNWKSYQLSVDVLRRERISSLAGDFDCLVVQPHMAFQGVFQQTGEVTLWISDDARRLPVLIKSKIKIGSININLRDAEWVEPQEQ